MAGEACAGNVCIIEIGKGNCADAALSTLPLTLGNRIMPKEAATILMVQKHIMLKRSRWSAESSPSMEF